MDRLLFRHGRSARLFGRDRRAGILVVVATVAQVVFLARVVDRMFLRDAGLEDVGALLLSLLGAVVVRTGLL